ncbi:hypothetical protein K488DRAFT_77122 [Vararia minispora EC-137]|uniref:Uncharacterized protein n=1 Tax=Vararia minispora EC-137 TaxID=1314806 RepID=A0ACB8QS05_9AGAM|nr:hypothetical protein K488DRAFT_77122 [Vararia minispora EC-137]
MKRVSPSLVSYSDSSEEETISPNVTHPKRRKLPALSSNLTVPVPVDDPSKHQGRIRSSPHVEGQWTAYVYVALPLRSPENKHLTDVIRGAFVRAASMEPNLHPLQSAINQKNGADELHISLTRPVYLRSHQREEFKQSVRRAAKARKPYVGFSFATFSQLTNDDQTRTFLCAEVGAGHHELRGLTLSLSPTLRQLRQKDYYQSPRFHASFAWVLLRHPRDISPSTSDRVEDAMEQFREEVLTPVSAPAADSLSAHGSYRAVRSLPDDLVDTLNCEFRRKLLSPAAIFDVGEVRVKIGKDVSYWKLEG